MTSHLRAVITGGASGLGRALAIDLAGRGGRVVVADIDIAGAEETAGLVESAGGEAHVVSCDVRESEAVEALAARSRELLGDVDLVANNAGVAVGGLLENIPLDDWQWIIDINLWGVIHGCRAFYPAMKERRRGYIINVASMAGLVYMPFMAPYNVTKAGVVALSETMHTEGKGYGVHVSVLCPSFFTTNIANSGRSPLNPKMAAWVQRAMARSKVQAPDVARVAIDAVLAGELHALPMRDGRVMWRIKRALPDRFQAFLGSRFMSRLERKVRGG